MNKTVLILGASSSIARAVGVELATRGYDLFLAGRNSDELQRLASDYQIRFGIKTFQHYLDAENFQSHQELMRAIINSPAKLTGVVCAIGHLGETIDLTNVLETQTILTTNFTACVNLLNFCADFLQQKNLPDNTKSMVPQEMAKSELPKKFIVAIGSVAGDRGRQSNFLYGSAKAGLHIYLQGLRNYLFNKDIHVITVKPGFVDTAMTYGMPNLFLLARPELIAKKIMQALRKKRDVIYTPWFWRYIMLIIKYIPEVFFKRLNL